MGGIIRKVRLSTTGQGLYELTDLIAEQLEFTQEISGLCSLFVRHTSCSLLIQENADPSVQHDLQRWMNRLVPEGDLLYTHLAEGQDDMPAHIKSMLTAVNLAVPYEHGQLLLGTWQGIFLWEHRHQNHTREIILHIN